MISNAKFEQGDYCFLLVALGIYGDIGTSPLMC